MTDLCIIKVGESGALYRVEVQVLEMKTIHGIECFIHHELFSGFVVSHVESGAQISFSHDKEKAISLAEFRLSDASVWESRVALVRDKILTEGHLYPVNPAQP